MSRPKREPITDLPILHHPAWKDFRNIIQVNYFKQGVDRKGRPYFRLEVKKIAHGRGRQWLLAFTTDCPACVLAERKDTTIHPFRERVKYGSIYFSMTHAIADQSGCSKGNASSEAHDVIRMAVEEWQKLIPKHPTEAAIRMVPIDDDSDEGYIINDQDW